MQNEVQERYKLQEAAEILVQGEAANLKKVLCNMRSSVLDGSLKVYKPNSEIFYEPNADEESCVRPESDSFQSDTNNFIGGITWVDKQYDERLREILYQVPDDLEAYWNDLNAWVEKNEPWISYRFPLPSAHIGTIHDITRERGCRRLILEHWPMITTRYGDKPDAREVLRVLEQHKSDYDKLPELKTVQNRLIDLRKEKLIP